MAIRHFCNISLQISMIKYYNLNGMIMKLSYSVGDFKILSEFIQKIQILLIL